LKSLAIVPEDAVVPLPAFDIFLSYKSDDAEWVAQLSRDLRKRGVKVWLDRQELRPGDLFPEALAIGMKSSRCVGLVVGTNTMKPGWVRAEYNRALSLSAAGETHLIPLLRAGNDLPDFLRDRHFVDFRSDSDYQQKLDALIWPGITGHKVMVFFHDIMVWDDLDDWVCFTEIIRKQGVELCDLDEEWYLKEEVPPIIHEGYRTVVISDPFNYWPWRQLNISNVKRSIEEIFELRQLTRGTEGETVFAFYTNPDALSKAPHYLDAKVEQRVRNYYHIPMTFYDLKAAPPPTGAEVAELRLRWETVWERIQANLMRSERRYFGKRI
jgi:hypothetical protein